MRAGGWIHATVWEEGADAPCAGCSVTLSPRGGPSLGLTTGQNGEGLSSPLTAGAYRVSLAKVVSTGSEIRVSNGGQAQEVEVLPGKTTRVRLGEARPALEVSFHPPPSPDLKLRVQAGSDDEIAALAADGLYHTRKRAGEAARLTLLTGRIGDLEVLQVLLPDGFDKPYLRLPLAQTRLSGRLLRTQGSAGPAQIEIVSQDGQAGLARGGADEQGYFTAAHLPPGSYALLIDGRSLRTLHLDEGQVLDLGILEIPSPALPAGKGSSAP